MESFKYDSELGSGLLITHNKEKIIANANKYEESSVDLLDITGTRYVCVSHIIGSITMLTFLKDGVLPLCQVIYYTNKDLVNIKREWLFSKFNVILADFLKSYFELE